MVCSKIPALFGGGVAQVGFRFVKVLIFEVFSVRCSSRSLMMGGNEDLSFTVCFSKSLIFRSYLT